MLELKKIVKDYVSGTSTVKALKGVDVTFRESEFVSILGPSGCGKTTMLNIIGGLDRYTSGDLIIDGVSTKEYGDRDWDNYRNHAIGFIFQSYNLIPHQNVLSNVELALTLSGVGKEERKKRAIESLEKVGLKDQIYKMPNQLSGGQMQRVAIARALVNNPRIILADEPTGALDSASSVQVMDILKGISKDRLIIMVTHNGDLAKEYSSRIITLKDGEVTGDNNPPKDEKSTKKAEKRKKVKKPNMSFLTALSLSLKNLFTKKGRTILTAFAGSIGIIGIALILSVSSGFQSYIDKVQEDSLSSYPVTIQQTSVDASAFLTTLAGKDIKREEYPAHSEEIGVNYTLGNMTSSAMQSLTTNDLRSFKKYIDANIEKSKINAIQYSYNVNKNVYDDNENLVTGINLESLMKLSGNGTSQQDSTSSLLTQSSLWSEMIDNKDLLLSQYELVGKHSKWADKENEIMLVVDKYNSISDYTMYGLGLRNPADYYYEFFYNMFSPLSVDEFNYMMMAYGRMFTGLPLPTLKEGTEESKNDAYKLASNLLAGAITGDINYTYDENKVESFSMDDIIGKEYKILVDADYFEYNNETNKYENKKNDKVFVNNALKSAVTVKIVGVIRQKQEATAGSISGSLAYNESLTKLLIDRINNSEVAKNRDEFLTDVDIGIVDESNPVGIKIYPTSFENKDYVISFINDYNANVEYETQKISFTDYIGILLGGVSTILDAITIVLTCFVGISLVVSSIMIGVITYISVLERTKEIGILRSIGASKRDIARVFNAETLIVGFTAGLMGIIISVLLCIPINLIITHFAPVLGNIAKLPVVGAIVLVIISMVLTFIAGLIPSSYASKKDPVVALRTE